MKKSLFILLAIFVALLATPSCKKEKGTEGPPAIEVSSVSVDKTTVGLKVGDKVKVMETRPLSKDKRWRVVEILEKGGK